MSNMPVPVQCIAVFGEDGIKSLMPLKIRYQDDRKVNVINKIKKLRSDYSSSDQKYIFFDCEGYVDGLKISFQLFYNSEVHKWFLYK